MKVSLRRFTESFPLPQTNPCNSQMRQPRHCYSSLNSTIHHRAQKRFAAGKEFNPRQPADGVSRPQPAGLPANAERLDQVSGSVTTMSVWCHQMSVAAPR
jgi:hypothetical protein